MTGGPGRRAGAILHNGCPQIQPGKSGHGSCCLSPGPPGSRSSSAGLAHSSQ